MKNWHYKFSIGLSSLLSILIGLNFRFNFLPGIERFMMLIVMSGIVLGLFVKETTLIQYSKSALRESLIFGLFFDVIVGSFLLSFDRVDDAAVVTIWNVLLSIAVLFLLGFTLSFFGLLIGVIPKYFASLRIRR